MDKLRAMATFVAIVDRGSLSAAAEHLDRSPAAVVRGLAELEKQLSVRLLNRSTRRIALTDEGREYLIHCRRILADVEAVEFQLDARKENLSGKLSITAPMMFGRLHIAPLVNRWLAEHPGMSVELTLVDRVVDVIEEGFDLALRIGHLEDSSLIAKTLGATGQRVCASPSLINRLGVPKTPMELAEWPAVVFTTARGSWSFQEDGNVFAQKLMPVLVTNQIDVMLEAAINGLGVTQAMSYQSKSAIASGDLVPMLDEYALPPLPVHFVYPHSRLMSPRVRQFIDWAEPRIRQLLAQ